MSTPTLVQAATFAGTNAASASVVHIPLPNASLSGNCLALAVAWATSTGTPSIAITDDQGTNTWVVGPTDFDATNTYNLSTWYALNVTAGTQKITITATGGTLSYVHPFIREFYNVATSSATDSTTAWHTHGTSASWGPGSQTTTVDGDLIWTVGVDSGGFGPWAAYAASGTGAALVGVDLVQGMADQIQIQTTHGAISPVITAAASHPFIACSIAFKAATAGTAPTASPRIIHAAWVDYWNTNTSIAQQFPCLGDTIAIGWVGASSGGSVISMTGVTDTDGNSYTLTTGVGTNLSGRAQWAYKQSATPSATKVVTITTGAADNLSTAILYDLAATSCIFDPAQNATGNVADAADLTSVSFTPTRANGVVLVANGVNNGTVRDATFNDNPWTDTEDGGGSHFHQDNGWGHYYNPDTSAVALTWTTSNVGVGDGVADWAAQAIGFSPAAAATAAVTGTATASITESDIVTGGKTIIITLTGDTWIPA